MSLGIDEIQDLFHIRGAAAYGSEAVSQLEHALQCARLAESSGASPELVCACLLHDLGHLVSEQPHAIGKPRDDLHQFIALPFLRGRFTDAVLEPIRLHVDAKRYLCAVDAGYRESLSPASRHSLALQGGAFSPLQAEGFFRRPYAADAVALRLWDDLAKTPRKQTPALGHYAEVLRACAM